MLHCSFGDALRGVVERIEVMWVSLRERSGGASRYHCYDAAESKKTQIAMLAKNAGQGCWEKRWVKILDKNVVIK